ncbi:MAG: DUF4282 domain-containing protein [Oscillospiraceae bacterium]|nr:DUF4282 domain-containing protein [Oscillospiraceae bacterium]
MPVIIAYILGFLFALAGVILALVFVTPEAKRPTLNKFLQVVADIFNFKQLLVEKILKFFYIFSTIFCIVAGFFMLFSVDESYFGTRSYALTGLLVMLLGPILIRLLFEGLMMFILLVKNTIDINKKLSGKRCDNGGDDVFSASAPVSAPVQPIPTPVQPIPTPVQPIPTPVQPEPRMLYCSQCGTRYDANQGNCPNCHQS